MIKLRFAIAALLLFCLGSHVQAKDNPYWNLLPKTEDAELRAAFVDPSYEWTSERERPKVFQHDFNTGVANFISVYKDIGPGGFRFSNGNGEWPWAHPATPTNDPTSKSLIGIKVTGVTVGKTQVPTFSIVTAMRGGGWAVDRVEREGSMLATDWKFAPGTDIIELNTNRILDGDYTYKVHRMTLLESGEWFFRVYRPFPNREAYEKATGTKIEYIGRQTKSDTDHMVRAFTETREVYRAPYIDPQLARKLLLETPFVLCQDDDFIPTTEHAQQLYPKNYLGVFIGNATNQENCRNCHRDVLTEVRRFDTGEWYGLIRGGGKDRHGAGVFSWYPR